MSTTADAGALPAPEPSPNTEDAPFWAGTAESRLMLPKCTGCGTVIWYPRQFCPECSGRDVEWIQASGRGTIYARTVVHRAQGPWRDAAPYVIAYVELEEGPRILTNIVGVDPETVDVGQEVRAVFAPAGAQKIVRFTR